MNLQDVKDLMEKELFGETPKDCCVSCKKPFSDKNVFTSAGWKETKISKMCEACWDDLFEDDE